MKNCIVSLLFVLTSAGVFAQELSVDQIIGKWMIDKVWEDERDVTTNHNPNNNRFIEFAEDGTFESGGDPYGANTGTYTFEPSRGLLYIDSDAGEDDDSVWLVKFESGILVTYGRGSERAARFKLAYRKG